MTDPCPNRPGTDRHPVFALALDDSRIDRARMARIARRILPGLQIDEVSDLAEFRVRLDQRRYDLVFLDYNLGAETGLQALAHLMDHPTQQQAAAIMLAGSTGPDLPDTAYRQGCMEFLPKDDIDEFTLARAIERARGRKQVALALEG